MVHQTLYLNMENMLRCSYKSQTLLFAFRKNRFPKVIGKTNLSLVPGDWKSKFHDVTLFLLWVESSVWRSRSPGAQVVSVRQRHASPSLSASPWLQYKPRTQWEEI